MEAVPGGKVSCGWPPWERVFIAPLSNPGLGDTAAQPGSASSSGTLGKGLNLPKMVSSFAKGE